MIFKSLKNSKKCVIISFVLSIIFEMFLVAYQNMDILQNQVCSFSTFNNTLFPHISFLRFISIFIVFFVSSCFLYLHGNIIGAFLYRYRYFFALAIVLFCVVFEISGSSVACWANILPGGHDIDSGTLLGISRPIRSDEYAVNTPMAFSQYYNQTGAFPYYGDTTRGAPTDMFMVYGQPVYNFMMVFRPFQLGYLFLSPAKGLAFFWSARLVALFMVSFEFGMLITKRSKSWSLSFAVLTTFSSAVQWWFAVNGFVEMLVFGQLAILILYHYLNTSRYLYRFLLTLALIVCAGTYILTFYPAWQVPLAYFFLALVLWVFFAEGNSKVYYLGRKDLGLLFLFVAVLASAMIYLLLRSGDTIAQVSNTVYPGKRAEQGGGSLSNLFFYSVSIFLPFFEKSPPAANVVELSSFLSLFPVGIILSLWIIFKERNRDRLLILLLAVIFLLGIYCAIPLPEWLAKLTLLSHSVSARVAPVFNFANMVLLIRAVSICKTHWKIRTIIDFLAIYAIVTAWIFKQRLPGYMTRTMMLISVIVLFSVAISLFFSINSKTKNAYLFVLSAICVSLFAGFSVNPIQQGTDVIYKNQLINDIYQITQDDKDKDLWLSEGDGTFIFNNAPIMVGAPTINCTNVYPNLECWKKLDPTGNYAEIYNRYAHILVNIQNSNATNFDLTFADAFKINLNVNDLKTLDVKYILSSNDLTVYNNENQNFNLLKQEGAYKIYRVIYS